MPIYQPDAQIIHQSPALKDLKSCLQYHHKDILYQPNMPMIFLHGHFLLFLISLEIFDSFQRPAGLSKLRLA